MRWQMIVLVLAFSVAEVESAQKDASDDIPVTGKAVPELVELDAMITRIIRENQLPGASVAVAHRGRIVYARGFGNADREKDEKVEPESMFRIASISKPFTSVAVLQLVERGKLKLDDHVFDVLKLEEPKGKFFKFDPRWKEITILNLLQHTGGWEREKTFDPMFISPRIVARMRQTPGNARNDHPIYVARAAPVRSGQRL